MYIVQDLYAGSSLQGSTATDLAFLVQERDAEIETLQATLDQREKEKVAHQEELTELRRSVLWRLVNKPRSFILANSC